MKNPTLRRRKSVELSTRFMDSRRGWRTTSIYNVEHRFRKALCSGFAEVLRIEKIEVRAWEQQFSSLGRNGWHSGHVE